MENDIDFILCINLRLLQYFHFFPSLQIALFWIIKTNVQSASIVLLITRSVHTYRNLNRENAICISGHASLNLPIIWLLEERSITFTPWKCHINRLVINQIGLPITIIIYFPVKMWYFFFFFAWNQKLQKILTTAIGNYILCFEDFCANRVTKTLHQHLLSNIFLSRF